MDIVLDYLLNIYHYTHGLVVASALMQWMADNTKTANYSKCKKRVTVMCSVLNETTAPPTHTHTHVSFQRSGKVVRARYGVGLLCNTVSRMGQGHCTCELPRDMFTCTRLAQDQASENSSMETGVKEELVVTDGYWGR